VRMEINCSSTERSRERERLGKRDAHSASVHHFLFPRFSYSFTLHW
jgi:hypothetical protein